jgi:hypothetical protein
MGALENMLVPLSLTSRFRSAAGQVLALLSVVTLGAGYAIARSAENEPVANTPAAAAATSSDGSNRLVLRFDGHVATGVLDDTAAAREFAAMLPMRLHFSDPMGQAKSGPLPRSRSLDVTGAARTLQARVGELAYW